MSRPHTFFLASSAGDAVVPMQFARMADALAARGHRVVRFVDHRRVDLEDADANPALLTWPSERPTRLADALFLRRQIAHFRPTCVAANFGSVNVMMLVGAAMRVPCRVSWYRSMRAQFFHDTEAHPWLAGSRLRRKRLVYRTATHIAAVSDAAREDARRGFGIPDRKLTTLYDGIVDPLGPDAPPVAEAEVPTIVNVGRFVRSKGQDVLLRALALVAETTPNIEAVLVGDGPTLARCKALATELEIAERCRFPGAVPHERVFAHLAPAHAVVVASRAEGFGLAAVEGVAMGKPVVVAATGGLPEIVHDDVHGLYFPPGDHRALADRLQTLIADPERRCRLGEAARRRFLDAFQAEARLAEQVGWLEAIADAAVR